ncbi:Mitochondrial inner membrane protein OXA1L [Dissostichus eleginoides]|uniref:Mitochondrial inner membrane protein OXA1L n=1 Tax=Dissostichus eleginoides TaxID=100907 RepID=A0AAD9BTF1_DISEL|nr:Mitochondrial inner membrane protein OXA1L [Dissostichus eleginoides]
MTAIRSGVNPACLARCFLRQRVKPSQGSHPPSDIWNHRLLQKSHLHTVFESCSPAARTLLGRRQNRKFLWVNAVAVRHNSSQSFSEQVADVSSTAAEVLQAVVTEPSLAALGLASRTPVGMVQNLLEYIHIDLGIPWWGAIVVGTVIARLAVFPVIVKGQREAAKLHNAPVFISFFIALRKMSELPVPSMQSGGLLWFPDLTAADPLYILPVVVTGTMFFILEFGAESGVENPQLRHLKTVFRIMPFVVLPFTISFPTAVFTYWLTSNCFSLGQVALLRHPLVRERLEKRSNGPRAGRETKKSLKSSGPRCLRATEADFYPQSPPATPMDAASEEDGKACWQSRLKGIYVNIYEWKR